MPKHVTENGEIVTADNPTRAIWYGQCGYWTDDWDVLTKVGPGIPACPKCKTPGFICVASQWFKGAEEFDKNDAGYLDFLNNHKQKCYRHYPKGFMGVWEITKENNEERKRRGVE